MDQGSRAFRADIEAYQDGAHDGHFRNGAGRCYSSCPHADHAAADLQSWRNCSHRADYASPAEHALNCPEHGGDAGPAPAAWRRADRFGIAEGDLIVGRDVRWGDSPVGAVAEIVQHYRHTQHAGNTYRIRCAALYPTGGPVEREVDHPSVIRRAGEPITCGRCGNEHATPDRFVDCQVAHLRADVEGAAGRVNGEARQASA